MGEDEIEGECFVVEDDSISVEEFEVEGTEDDDGGVQGGVLNHHFTNKFVPFSPFHHQKIAKITITTSFLILLITNKKIQITTAFFRHFSLKMK